MMLGNGKWVSLALMSVIIPISLLTTFRLTGILPEPQKPEETPLQPVYWNMSRPANVDIITIDKWTKHVYTDNIAFIELNIHLGGYWENKPGWWPSDGDDDVIDFMIDATANVSDGFIYSMTVRFPEVDVNSVLYISMDKDFRKLINLQESSISCCSKYKGGAYFEAISPNRSKNVSLLILSYWVLKDQNNVDHAITATLETIYFNGTTYLKVILPIHLNIWLDAGDNFETAKIMRIYAPLNESLGAGNDFEDYYSVLVDIVKPGKFEVCIIPSSNVDFDLYVYNQNRELIANSTSRETGKTERLIVTLDSGWWYIRVADPIKLENGTYTLTIKGLG